MNAPLLLVLLWAGLTAAQAPAQMPGPGTVKIGKPALASESAARNLKGAAATFGDDIQSFCGSGLCRDGSICWVHAGDRRYRGVYDQFEHCRCRWENCY